MNYITFDFKTTSPDQSEQLIALLSNQNFNGFEETDQHLKAFIAEESYDQNTFDAITALFPELIYERTIIENINWNKQWEESFQPVLVNDFVAIRAHFHPPITTVQHEIIITPKMSFGTGHHATTHLMIQEMASVDFIGKTVLDFGTGTGILAILAEKLGASKVFAIDNDEWSITNTKENIAQNNCSKIIIEQHDLIPVTDTYDFILANINLNVITANLAAIKSVTNKACTILLSGFLKENETTLLDEVKAMNFKHVVTLQKGQWIALHVTN